MHDAAVSAVMANTAENEALLTLEQTKIIGPVDKPSDEEFPGLYSFNLAATVFPANPFLSTLPSYIFIQTFHDIDKNSYRCYCYLLMSQSL